MTKILNIIGVFVLSLSLFTTSIYAEEIAAPEQTIYPPEIAESNVVTTSIESCIAKGGQYTEFDECLGVSGEACKEIGGVFDSCASACRHDPDADMCIQVCDEVCYMGEIPTVSKVTDYNSCVKAGGVIMESYPEQCRVNNQIFVRKIDNDDKEPVSDNDSDNDERDSEKDGDDNENIDTTDILLYVIIFMLGAGAGVIFSARR